MSDAVVKQLAIKVAALERRLKRLEVQRPTWQNWTPVLYQAAEIASVINYAKYLVIGKTVILRAYIIADAAGTAGNRIFVRNQPYDFSYEAGRVAVGSFIIADGSANYVGTVDVFNSTSGLLFNVGGGGTNSFVGQNPSFALAPGSDSISFMAIYERL